MEETVQSPPSADVCVVGSGPAGLTAALELGSAGRTVVLLESGPDGPSPTAQELNEGDCRGEPYRGLRGTRHRRVGGTVNIWDVEVDGQPAAKYVPLSDRDMAGWPIRPDDLEPYYVEAQRVCGLGPYRYAPGPWTTGDRRPFDLEGTGLTSGIYQIGTAARFLRDLPERIRRMGSVRLVPSATVVELLLGPSRRSVRGVRAVRPGGASFEVEARAVVLACGAVENARLLLLAGLGGDGGSPWVGRGFMEHARDFSPVLVPARRGIFAEASFYDAHPVEDGYWVGGRLGPTEEAMEAHDLPGASLTLVPRARGRRGPVERMLRAVHGAVLGGREGRYGWSRVPFPGRAFDVFEIVLNLEQRPHPRNRIELGERRDRHGNRLPRLVLRWTEREQARLERLRGLLKEWFRAAGLGRLQVSEGSRPDLSAHHHAGTTRMGAGPGDGVVDADGRVFGVDNLYVAGASVFPTAGFANPVLTIVATTLRLARRLSDRLG